MEDSPGTNTNAAPSKDTEIIAQRLEELSSELCKATCAIQSHTDLTTDAIRAVAVAVDRQTANLPAIIGTLLRFRQTTYAEAETCAATIDEIIKTSIDGESGRPFLSRAMLKDLQRASALLRNR